MWSDKDKQKATLYLRYVIERLKNENIPIENIETVSFVETASYFGYSVGYTDNTYEIKLSDMCLCSKHILYNTIIHEVLHCVNDSIGHDTLWKQRAEKANNIFKVNISRTASNKEMLAVAEYRNKKAKHIFLDRNTHIIYRYFYDCKTVKRLMKNSNYKKLK